MPAPAAVPTDARRVPQVRKVPRRPTVVTRRILGSASAPREGLSRSAVILIVSLAGHLIAALFLLAWVVSQPAPDDEAVVYVTLTPPMPVDPDLRQAPVELAGFAEPLPEDGVPVEVEEASDHVETPDEEERPNLAKGSLDGRSLEPAPDDGETEDAGVIGVGGGEAAGTFGVADGGGLIESSIGHGAREGLRRFRAEGLDVVILFDTTASMAHAIDGAKRNIKSILKLTGELVPDVRFGIVTYGSQVRDVVALTADRAIVEEGIERQLPVTGGGTDWAALGQALELALSRMSWRPGAWRSVIVIGDVPAHPTKRASILGRLSTEASGDERLVLSTISSSVAGTLVPTYGELAAAGRGEALRLEGAQSIGRTLVRLSFGPEVGAEVDRWVEENEWEAAKRYGFEIAEHRLLAIGSDTTRAPEVRLDAITTSLKRHGSQGAQQALLDLLAAQPELMREPLTPDRLAEALRLALPESLDSATRRAVVLERFIRQASHVPHYRLGRPLARILELDEETRAGTGFDDPRVTTTVIRTLARVGGGRAGRALVDAIGRDASAVDDVTLLEALVTAPSPEMRDVILDRMEGDPGFAERCLSASDPRARAAVGALIIRRLAASEGGVEDDERLAHLAGLPAETLADAFHTAFAIASHDAEEQGVGAVLSEVGARLGASAFEELVLESRLSLDVLLSIEAARPTDGARGVLDVVAGRLEEASSSELRKLLRRVHATSDAARTELAARLIPALERTDGARRRDLFRLFAPAVDARGLDLLVRSLRWDRHRLMEPAIAALRRVTGFPFPKKKRGGSARERQILEIEWWWEQNRHEWE